MTVTQPPNLLDLLARISEHLPPGKKVYLVGGAVRDMLLSRPVHDLDFVLDGNAISTARKTANRLGAAFFPLDEEHDAGRVVLQESGQPRTFLDFASLRGADLESDLRARDFTINAMALDAADPETLIDPLNGSADLRSKLLRACSSEAFENDPLRIVRGARLAAAFQFQLQPETVGWMRQAAPLLPTVSSERLRDELFKILSGPLAVAALRVLDTLEILPHTFPELVKLKGVEQSPPHIYDVWNHTLAVLQRLEEVLNALHPQYDPETAGSLNLGLMVLKLGRFRQFLGEHLQEQLNPERSLHSLLLYAALYHDIAKPLTFSKEESGRIRFFEHDLQGAQLAYEAAQRLHLSNAEINRVRSIVRHHLRPILLAQSGDLPSHRAVYRFFRDTGVFGIDVCLISLADVLATYGHTLPVPVWTAHLDVVRSLLEAWWEKPKERVSPKPLLNGREIMDALNLQAGPQIGEMLEALREAQATGKVNSRAEALELLRKML